MNFNCHQKSQKKFNYMFFNDKIVTELSQDKFCMSNDGRVTIRLSNEQYFLYEMRAAAKGMKLSAYVKSLLDEKESEGGRNAISEISNSIKELDKKASLISEILTDQENSKDTAKMDGALDNVSMELLLLLRAIAKPEQLKMAHSRMREKNIPIVNLQDY